MQILLGYFLFSVLLRTGATFQCKRCRVDAATCTASLQNCNAGENSCVKRLSQDVTGEKTQTKVAMACIEASQCTKQFIELSYEKGVYARVQYDCCNTDGCTPPTTIMPALNTTVNKKYCPVCSLETGTCSGDVTLECTGSATHCFASSILKDGAKRPVKGCTTEAVCNILKTYKGPLVGNSTLEDVTCKEATSDSSCSSLEVFLLALLPIKLLFFSAY
ncbi:phospholipase A2 inhibitor and Ly6/PLAUR domain-containing protein [Protobothrops mucrosquamatus]|uniref:phospholipase A2 inhibitor and Ly6/PLAUR domain-containing protein n=1 Tax=Protobothrops mucrosquamatus TaxID=103944 RepID=UPI000775C399|nr:phospholipase A2 inhibitor and Ly6/PLAUR domain-containing protein [Protobothrops mucrosquamatus]